MKFPTKFIMTSSIMTLIMFSTVALFGQIADSTTLSLPDIIDGLKNIKSVPEALMYEFAISSLLQLIAGYIAPFVPFVNKIKSTTWKVAAFIIIVVAVVVNLGITTTWMQLLAYLFTTNLYKHVIQFFAKNNEIETMLRAKTKK